MPNFLTYAAGWLVSWSWRQEAQFWGRDAAERRYLAWRGEDAELSVSRYRGRWEENDDLG